LLLKKITVTLDQKTVADLDRWVREGRYSNRNRALQSAVDLLVELQKRCQLTRELANSIRPRRSTWPKRGSETARGRNTEGRDLLGRSETGPRTRTGGHRPVLVRSHDIFNRHSGRVIAMAITSRQQRAGFPLTLALPQSQLPKPSWVKSSQIRTISVDRLGKRIGSVSTEDLNQAVNGLLELIG